jgi:tetratricopeptide (TPR) repeat protein
MLLFFLPLRIQRFLYAVWDRWCVMAPMFRNTILLVLLTGAGLVFYGPYVRAKEKKELQTLRSALAASLQAGDFAQARQASQALIRRDQADLETLRTYQKSTAELGDPTHAEAARRLLAHPQAGAPDRLRCLEGAARFAPLAEVLRVWRVLPAADQRQLPVRAVLAERLLRQQLPSRAWDLLVHAAEAGMTIDLRLLSARILLAMGDPSHALLAQERLVRAWRDFPQYPDEILAVLEEIPADKLSAEVLAPLRAELARGIRGYPGRAEMMELRIAWVGATPSERSQSLTEAVIAWANAGADPLVLTLHHLGDFERLLAVQDQTDYSTQAQRLRWRLDALQALGQVEPLQRTFRRHGEILPMPYFNAYAALVARAVGSNSDKTVSWQNALEEAAAADPWGRLELAAFARQRQADELAAEAFQSALARASGPLPDFEGLRPWLRELSEAGDEARMMEVLSQAVKIEPDHPLLLAQYTTLAAFTRRESPAGLLRILVPALARYPDQAYLHEAAAALHLLDGNAAEAVRFCQDAERLAPPSPRLRALQVVAAVRNNQMLPDHPRVAEIEWNPLLPSEKTTLRGLVQKF